MAGFLNGIATNTMEFRDEFFADADKVKWSVKGSGVMVKNGVVTAKSLSKTDKKGNVNPAVVTLSCGKQTYSIQVYVSE